MLCCVCQKIPPTGKRRRRGSRVAHSLPRETLGINRQGQANPPPPVSSVIRRAKLFYVYFFFFFFFLHASHLIPLKICLNALRMDFDFLLISSGGTTISLKSLKAVCPSGNFTSG